MKTCVKSAFHSIFYCLFLCFLSQSPNAAPPSISMAAERTSRSIWLIIFTLPAEAGLSWGYLHLSHLPFFVQFNNGYYPTNHLFLSPARSRAPGTYCTHPGAIRSLRHHSLSCNMQPWGKRTKPAASAHRRKDFGGVCTFQWFLRPGCSFDSASFYPSHNHPQEK